jgi:hypothetical protein
MSVLVESKFRCNFPEALSAQMKPVFVYVRLELSATQTLSCRYSAASLLWLAMLKELLSL